MWSLIPSTLHERTFKETMAHAQDLLHLRHLPTLQCVGGPQRSAGRHAPGARTAQESRSVGNGALSH